MGIFDKVKKFANDIEKKVENLDDSLKKFDDKLSGDESIIVQSTGEDYTEGAEIVNNLGINIEEGYSYDIEEKRRNGNITRSKDGITEIVCETNIIQAYGWWYFVTDKGAVARGFTDITGDNQSEIIISLLGERGEKITSSDIYAVLSRESKHMDGSSYQILEIDELKEILEEMYHNGEISRTSNYRYFVLTDEKKKPKKDVAAKSETADVEKELEKFKGMVEKGLITDEDYDAKKKELLGL